MQLKVELVASWKAVNTVHDALFKGVVNLADFLSTRYKVPQ